MHNKITFYSVGWYLLLPLILVGTGYPVADTKAPLGKWSHYKSFDSAKECESYKNKHIHDEEEVFDKLNEQFAKDHLFSTGNASHLSAMKVESAKNGECIASDDPRLRQ